ncbi:MAG: hypothetical protein WBA12_00250 [Catalinimonas sp.]
MVVKPKSQSFFALGVVLALGWVGLVSLLVQNVQRPSVWGLVGIPLLLALVIGLTLKLAWDWKVITTGKGQLEVRQPLLGRRFTLPLGEMESSEEVEIKTPAGTYRQFEMRFARAKITVNEQQHAQYAQLRDYVRRGGRKQRRRR